MRGQHVIKSSSHRTDHSVPTATVGEECHFGGLG
jgi:hypothetical protein